MFIICWFFGLFSKDDNAQQKAEQQQKLQAKLHPQIAASIVVTIPAAGESSSRDNASHINSSHHHVRQILACTQSTPRALSSAAQDDKQDN